MTQFISALIKRPGEPPRHVNLSNSLEALQKNVGGYLETVTFYASSVVIICNEEGRLRGLPYNCKVCGVDFVGTIIMCGIDGEEFTDLPWTWQNIKNMFPELWEVRA